MDRVEGWINELVLEGYSAATVRIYRWHVEDVMRQVDKDLLDLKASDITRYLAARRLQGWGDSAVKLAVNALRSFYARTVGKKKSPAQNIKVPRPKPKPQMTLTVPQAMAVISSCDTSGATGQRDLALLCLLLDTGLRNSEVCRLELQHVNMDERRLMALVKGRRWQPKVFGRYTASQLHQWLSSRAVWAGPDVKTLFVSVGGLTPGRPLTARGLRVIFKNIGQRCGLEKFSPHVMRRSFATLSIKFGASTRLVQEQGGWEDVTLVERYTQTLLPEDAEPYLPVGRLMGL